MKSTVKYEIHPDVIDQVRRSVLSERNAIARKRIARSIATGLHRNDKTIPIKPRAK